MSVGHKLFIMVLFACLAVVALVRGEQRAASWPEQAAMVRGIFYVLACAIAIIGAVFVVRLR